MIPIGAAIPVIKPKGGIGLCAYYKITLNKATKDEVYSIPIAEDIL